MPNCHSRKPRKKELKIASKIPLKIDLRLSYFLTTKAIFLTLIFAGCPIFNH